MKTIFLIRSLNRGGTERQIVLLARELRRHGVDVRVAVFYGGGELESDLARAGVSVDCLEKRGRFDLVRCLLNLIAYIRREKPATLVSYLTDANVIAALAKPFIGPTKLVWGVRASEDPTLPDHWAARVSFAASCALSRSPDLIIFNSHSGLRFHCDRGYRPRKAAVIHNGFDTVAYRRLTDQRKLLRGEWGVDEATWLIGVVGRLDPIKGHELFIQAAALLSLERTDIRFVMVGAGSPERRKELQALAYSGGVGDIIIWAGARQDMPSVYSALDILTLPSRAEGFPNSVGEAMACETPCVVCRVGDASEIVGNTGVVVPPDDPAQLRDGWVKMMNLSTDELTTRRVEARRRVEANFSLEALAGAMTRALAEV